MPEPDRRDEVAAHQAECFCHRTSASGTEDIPGAICGPWRIAADSSGDLWHVDPLCKVRPGRGVETRKPLYPDADAYCCVSDPKCSGLTFWGIGDARGHEMETGHMCGVAFVGDDL